MNALAAARFVLRKDLLIELRTKEIVVTTGLFAVLVVVLASLSFYLDPGTAPNLAPGALWIAITFAGVLAMGRSWARERENDAMRGLLLSPIPRSGIYLGKAAAAFVYLSIIEVLLPPLVALFFHLDPLPVLGPVVALLVLRTIGFVAAPETRFVTTLIPAGARRVWIKAHDSVRTEAYPNGQESVNAVYVDLTVVDSNTSVSVEYALSAGTATNMVQLDSGYWVTSFGSDSWDALFTGAMDTYTNAVDTYHASGTSSLVSATVDGDVSELCTITADPDYADLSGTGQVYIEHKVNSGDSWTRVNASTAVVTARYFRVGVEWTTTETGLIYSLGVLRKSVDATEQFVQYTVFNDPAAWV